VAASSHRTGKLRKGEAKRGDGRWEWKDGSAELTKVKKLLSE
jgi:hypothetical protein